MLQPIFVLRTPGFPTLQSFLDLHLEMQIQDVRTLLQMPRPASTPDALGAALSAAELDLRGGCNLATTTVLLNLLSGASVVFHEPGAFEHRMRSTRIGPVVLGWLGSRKALQSGARFRGFVQQYVPVTGNVSAKKMATVLYDYARNPLTHSFGINRSASRGRVIEITKAPLTERQIGQLEGSPTLPSWCSPIVNGDGAGNFVIGVPALYWGLLRSFDQVFGDSRLCAVIENALSAKAP